MSAFVSMRELFSLLMPPAERRGVLAMINAYFDDSGTHASSDVVIMAGIVGTEPDLLSLDDMWAAHLERPLGGLKPPIKRFHMTDCYNSLGEFSGWSRVETDYFCHELREVIIKSHVGAYGFACVRKEWDAEMTDEYRLIFGDAEGYAVRACMHSTINWARNSSFDPHMYFVFDDRPERQKENEAVFKIYQQSPRPPQLVGISFMNSHKVRPLQAADLLAWEFYTHAKGVLLNGPKHKPRDAITHLLKNTEMYGQMTTPREISIMKASVLEQEKTDPVAREIFNSARILLSSAGEQPSQKRRQMK